MNGACNCEVERVFIGAGCNRIINNVSWGASDLVSFGAHNSLAILCPKRAQILITLPGHKATVNCTFWLPSSKFAFKAQELQLHYLLSGDADGTIMLWELSLVDGKGGEKLGYETEALAIYDVMSEMPPQPPMFVTEYPM